jgi:hypothetical protein
MVWFRDDLRVHPEPSVVHAAARLRALTALAKIKSGNNWKGVRICVRRGGWKPTRLGAARRRFFVQSP